MAGFAGEEGERRVGVDQQPARVDRVVADHVGVPAEPHGRAERDAQVGVAEQVVEAADLAVGRGEQVGPDAGVRDRSAAAGESPICVSV